MRQFVRVKNGKLLRDREIDGISRVFFYVADAFFRGGDARQKSISDGMGMAPVKDDQAKTPVSEWTACLAATMLDLGLSYLCIITVIGVLQPLLNQHLLTLR